MAEPLATSDILDALESSNSLVQACWDVVDMPVLVLDAGGDIRLCNRACSALIGYDCAEIQGEPAVDLLVAPEEQAAVSTTLETLQAEPSEARRTVTCLTKSGERRRVRWTGRSLGSADQVQAIIATGTPLETGAAEAEESARAATIPDIQDELLKEIGDELHDGVVSHLAGTTMYAEALSRKVCAGTAEPEDAQRLVRYLREGMSQARQLAHRFAAEGVDRTHFPEALRKLAKLAEQQSAVTVECHIDARAPMPSDEVAQHLYRIAQEATINAVRHGNPNHIEIQATVGNEQVRLEVLDDGEGFAPDAEPGVGLRSMCERGQRIGGRVKVEPRDTAGVAVRCVVPQDGSCS
jgi:PAS domain S-box-containing protein